MPSVMGKLLTRNETFSREPPWKDATSDGTAAIATEPGLCVWRLLWDESWQSDMAACLNGLNECLFHRLRVFLFSLQESSPCIMEQGIKNVTGFIHKDQR